MKPICLLKKAKGTKDMFHYTLYWLTRYVENSKIMGMDGGVCVPGRELLHEGRCFLAQQR